MNILPVSSNRGGPVGLAAAANLAKRKLPFVIVEQGSEAGAAIREWQHVSPTSAWRYSVDQTAREMLEARGWSMPEPDRDPTGRELIEDYLAPLAAHPSIAPHLRLATHVVSVTRVAMDRVPSKGRRMAAPSKSPPACWTGAKNDFWRGPMIDASGTSLSPNPAGASGVAAVG